MCSRMCYVLKTNFCLLVLACTTLTKAADKLNDRNMDMEPPDYRKSACYGKPLCGLPILPEEGTYKCLCDSNCSYYGDCCPDSPYRTNTSHTRPNETQKFLCPKKFKFLMVGACPSSFSEVETRRKCENVSFEYDYEDLKIMKPVMDPASRITYVNAYCAQCNGITRFERFNSSFSCQSRILPPLKNEDKDKRFTQVLIKAKFNNETKLFTSVYNGTEYNCSHKVVVPAHMTPYLRYCEPELISSCPQTFNDSKVRDECLSSTYVVYSDSEYGSGFAYKNEYCARCNGVEDTNRLHHCQHPKPHRQSGEGSGSSSLFTLNPSPGIGDSCENAILCQVLQC